MGSLLLYHTVSSTTYPPIYYCRLYGTKCAGCKTGLCPEDMVRRAMDKVYHLTCFSCSLCRKELQTGEQLFLVQVYTYHDITVWDILTCPNNVHIIQVCML